MASISKVSGSRHVRDESACVGARYMALIATLPPAATMSCHVGRCREEDAVGVDCTLLVGSGAREHLMFDEVVGKPVRGVVEVLVAANFLGEGAQGLHVFFRCGHAASLGSWAGGRRGHQSLMASLPEVIRPRPAPALHRW
jgi:hypothetical protein